MPWDEVASEDKNWVLGGGNWAVKKSKSMTQRVLTAAAARPSGKF
jgi:hypothetical protein